MKQGYIATFRILLVIVGLITPVAGQVVSFPAWRGDPSLYDPQPYNVPQPPDLVPTQVPYHSVIDWWSTVDAHGCSLERFLDSGILAVLGPLGSPLFGIDSGLDTIYSMSESVDSTGMRGVTVNGRVGGVPKVLFLPFSVGAPPSSFVFTELLSSTAGQIFLHSKLFSTGVLYVYEASGCVIYRFSDSDADGFPDLGAPTYSIALSSSGVRGSSFCGFGVQAPYVTLRDRLRSGDNPDIVRLDGGALTIEPHPVDMAVPPYVVGQALHAGLTRLRVQHLSPGQIVAAEVVGTGEVLGKVYINAARPYSLMKLDRPLHASEQIRLSPQSVGVDSPALDVAPKGLSVTSNHPYSVVPGQAFVLHGTGFSEKILVVDCNRSGGSYTACAFVVIDDGMMVLTAPSLTAGDDGGLGRFRFRIVNSLGVTEQTTYRPYFIENYDPSAN